MIIVNLDISWVQFFIAFGSIIVITFYPFLLDTFANLVSRYLRR